MDLKITIPQKALEGLIPDSATIAKSAGEAVADLVKENFQKRNDASKPEAGMPKSNYWDEVSQSTRVEIQGEHAVVTIDKEGAALHFYGGTVLPGNGKKALAIPKHPKTAGKRAAEFTGEMFCVWGKGDTYGMLVSCDVDTAGELMYLLIPKANIKPDPSVLPTEAEMLDAAIQDIEFQRSIWS